MSTTVAGPVRFRFDEFVISPRQRLLLRNGVPVPLIPKYFDLLVLLVERRGDAVSKDAIFSAIWTDVIVSDGALAQAVRTLRRTLGDNPREPRFIRTVSRHGYQFVYTGLIEEADLSAPPTRETARPVELQEPLTPSPLTAPAAEIGKLVDRLMDRAAAHDGSEDARDAAERLHALDTAQAVALVKARPQHAQALAMLRDTRWDVAGAGPVPLDPATISALIRLRIDEAGRVVARRWAAASAAGALGGALAGTVGGIALYLSPQSMASPRAALALGAIGALAGAVGAAGVGAGLAAAEVLARSRRGFGLLMGGALGGLLVAAAVDVVLRALLDGFIGGRELSGNIPFEGLLLGAMAGLGYAVATKQPPGGGLAAPHGGRRLAVAAIVALFTATAAVVLTLGGGMLVGGIINEIAGASPDAQLALAPLGRIIGEPDFGPVTRVLLSAFEGGAFGFALSWGLTRRPS